MSTTDTRRPGTVATREGLVGEVLAWIAANYSRAVGLDDCAAEVFVARRTAQRALADAGTSWRAELAAARMRVAAALLTGSAMTVKEVAASVGYRQPAQFAKAFRVAHGKSPGDFRRTFTPAPRAADRNGATP